MRNERGAFVHIRFLFTVFFNNRLVQQHQELEKRLQELEKQKQPQQPGQRNLPPTPDQQRLVAEINALKQRLQESGARSENEVEQWRKVVEQEKVKCFLSIEPIYKWMKKLKKNRELILRDIFLHQNRFELIKLRRQHKNYISVLKH